jgi:hypothetical protein
MPRKPPVKDVQRDNMIHVPGSYENALLESCKREVTDPCDWLTASADAATFAEYEREVAVLADLLFDERVGEPVIAWWYWLQRPLPPPLHELGRAADAPRRFRVIPGDLVEPVTR